MANAAQAPGSPVAKTAITLPWYVRYPLYYLGYYNLSHFWLGSTLAGIETQRQIAFETGAEWTLDMFPGDVWRYSLEPGNRVANWLHTKWVDLSNYASTAWDSAGTEVVKQAPQLVDPSGSSAHALTQILGFTIDPSMLVIGLVILAVVLAAAYWYFRPSARKARKKIKDKRKDQERRWKEDIDKLSTTVPQEDKNKSVPQLFRWATYSTMAAGGFYGAAYALSAIGALSFLAPIFIGLATVGATLAVAAIALKLFIAVPTWLFSEIPEPGKEKITATVKAPEIALDAETGQVVETVAAGQNVIKYPKGIHNRVVEKQREEIAKRRANDQKAGGTKPADDSPETRAAAQAELALAVKGAMPKAIQSWIDNTKVLIRSIKDGTKIDESKLDSEQKLVYDLIKAAANDSRIERYTETRDADGHASIKIEIKNDDRTKTTLLVGPYGISIEGALKDQVIQPLLTLIKDEYEGKIVYSANMSEDDQYKLFCAAEKANDTAGKTVYTHEFPDTKEETGAQRKQRFEEKYQAERDAATSIDEMIDQNIWKVNKRTGEVEQTFTSFVWDIITRFAGRGWLYHRESYVQPTRGMRPPAQSRHYSPAPAAG